MLDIRGSKALQEYEPYLHIFWKCVRDTECTSIGKTSTEIDHQVRDILIELACILTLI